MISLKNKEDLISVLICSKDRRQDLEHLAAELKQIASDHSLEIVVVEETDEPIPIDSVRYVSHPVANRGIPYARNLALSNANGRIIVFLDDDCLIHENWLDNLLMPFQEGSIVGVQGGVCVPDETNSIGWAESILGVPGGGIRRIYQAKGKVQETREISTLNCAYRSWAINKVGGFEKQLKITGEDYLLAKQVCNYGRCVFVPDAMVSHKARGKLLNIWHWFIRRGRAEIDVIRTGKQRDTTYWTVLRSSLIVKLFFLILITTVLTDQLFFLTLAFLSLYTLLQLARYHGAWRFSGAPLLALVLLPVVKVTMDIAMDWGRFRGIVFD
jgi:GT2 family glycosyltransferase